MKSSRRVGDDEKQKRNGGDGIFVALTAVRSQIQESMLYAMRAHLPCSTRNRSSGEIQRLHFGIPKVQEVGIHALAFKISGTEHGQLSQLSLCSGC